jgi:hypothetical protein
MELDRALKEHAYSMTMIAQAMITAMGMHAENEQRKVRGESMAYVSDDFERLINDNGIHHNAVLTQWSNP